MYVHLTTGRRNSELPTYIRLALQQTCMAYSLASNYETNMNRLYKIVQRTLLGSRTRREVSAVCDRCIASLDAKDFA